MKIHTLSIIGGVSGLTIILCSIVRWFIIWYDPSQMIFGVSVGVVITVFSYIYNWMREQDEENIKVNKCIDAFSKWLIKQEV